ncbi:hypothetical protein [Leucothrix mucor]|uniref:hypothetical protein n=1 Tax=Leucothrix mucor TaxID=45248 RepID=UPI0003B5CA0D|nr:hypothetical protein [Leucothrix mucor]
MKAITPILLSLALLAPLSGTAAEQKIDLARVVSAATGDWNKDGMMDRAFLVAPAGNDDSDVALHIYLGEQGSPLPKLEIVKPNLVWSGAMWGTTPSLTIGKSGSLEVHSQNEAIGRNRWSQKLTLAYRKGAFVVAGYTYNSYDTLDLSAGLSCDVNLLTGGGIKDKKSFKIAGKMTKLADWSEAQVPAQCQE